VTLLRLSVVVIKLMMEYSKVIPRRVHSQKLGLTYLNLNTRFLKVNVKMVLNRILQFILYKRSVCSMMYLSLVKVILQLYFMLFIPWISLVFSVLLCCRSPSKKIKLPFSAILLFFCCFSCGITIWTEDLPHVLGHI
jgi:hypothetical protein